LVALASINKSELPTNPFFLVCSKLSFQTTPETGFVCVPFFRLVSTRRVYHRLDQLDWGPCPFLFFSVFCMYLVRILFFFLPFSLSPDNLKLLVLFFPLPGWCRAFFTPDLSPANVAQFPGKFFGFWRDRFSFFYFFSPFSADAGCRDIWVQFARLFSSVHFPMRPMLPFFPPLVWTVGQSAALSSYPFCDDDFFPSDLRTACDPRPPVVRPPPFIGPFFPGRLGCLRLVFLFLPCFLGPGTRRLFFLPFGFFTFPPFRVDSRMILFYVFFI